jgi:hypothetical protein
VPWSFERPLCGGDSEGPTGGFWPFSSRPIVKPLTGDLPRKGPKSGAASSLPLRVIPYAINGRCGRRSRPDPLTPVNERRWLVVRDELSQPVEAVTLAPLADLRAALLEERQARAQEGWQVDEVAPAVAFFFCTRDGSRRCIRIEAFAPGTAPL